MDFANGTMTMYSSNNCDGNAISWTQGSYARIRFYPDRDAHISIPIELDGHDFSAVIDTSSAHSFGSLETIGRTFGFDEKNAEPIAGAKDQPPAYRYPFKVLSFQNVVLESTDVELVPRDTRQLMADTHSNLLLGMDFLSRLHLFIAYPEHTIYITRTNAH